MTAVDHVERRLELAVAGDDLARRVTGHTLRSDLLGGESEDENVLGADLLANLDVRAIEPVSRS